jgi:ribosomal protein S18 acetylase RimI-like enzyme
VELRESQLLLYTDSATAPPFLVAGFTLYPRLFMECDLTPGSEGLDRLRANRVLPPPVLPPSLSLRHWSGAHYEAAASLIHESYVGHLDALINDQYRSMHGSIRFLHNIVRFPGCGVFEPDASWVVFDQQSNRLAGMLLCSVVSDKVAHITQLCVGPEYRGTGLGRALLRHCIYHLFQMGYESITLTVTQENQLAVRLYRQFGFFVRHRFDAMVLEKTHPFNFNV